MNTIYQFTQPVFVKHLGGIQLVLDKTESFLKEKGMSEEEFLNSRMWEDMFTFTKQVQVACDNAKGAMARLAGVEVPSFEDTEKSIADLRARVEKTLAFVNSIKEEQFENAAEIKVSLSYWGGKHMTGFDYARFYALPNFFFHVTTAYNLARKIGVPVGKADYMNGAPLRD